MTRFETFTLLRCALRAADAFSYRSRPAAELSDWLERNPLGFDWTPNTVPLAPTKVSNEDWSDLRIETLRVCRRLILVSYAAMGSVSRAA